MPSLNPISSISPPDGLSGRGPYRLLDLFSGIGGFSLGLERSGGFKTVAFCEIEPFCRKVLAKHWPEVPCYDDIRTLTGERLAADGIAVDAICGGFPCQDISSAGKGAGINGERSGLWAEYARLVGELRPAIAIIENVAALRSRGADRVLTDLETLGYTAEPAVVGAVHVGAPHRRQRVWIVAYTTRFQQGRQVERPIGQRAREGGQPISLAHTDLDTRQPWGKDYAFQSARGRHADRGGIGADLADADHARLEIRFQGNAGQQPSSERGGWWLAEPDVGRVAHGVPSRVDRLKALGNAVVPQIPELIGRAILQAELAAA